MSSDIDFRTRTGQARRAKTRKRIVSAAFELFDERGVGQVTIDQVRESAGLSRGTFYHYFDAYEAMLVEFAHDIVLQINREQDELQGEPDVVRRAFNTMNYFLCRAASDRACCEIIVRVMSIHGAPTGIMQDKATESFAEIQKKGLINVPSIELALDASFGIGVSILRRALSGTAGREEIIWSNLMFLRAIGVPEAALSGFDKLPLPGMPETRLRDFLVATKPETD